MGNRKILLTTTFLHEPSATAQPNQAIFHPTKHTNTTQRKSDVQTSDRDDLLLVLFVNLDAKRLQKLQILIADL